MSVHVCGCVHTCVEARMYVGCLPSLCTLFFEIEFLTEPAAHQFAKHGWSLSSWEHSVSTFTVMRLQDTDDLP